MTRPRSRRISLGVAVAVVAASFSDAFVFVLGGALTHFHGTPQVKHPAKLAPRRLESSSASPGRTFPRTSENRLLPATTIPEIPPSSARNRVHRQIFGFPPLTLPEKTFHIARSFVRGSLFPKTADSRCVLALAARYPELRFGWWS